MKSSIGFAVVLITMMMSGCSTAPSHPGEEQVKAILAGRYCSGDFRHTMEIGRDGRYTGHRSKRSPFGTGLLPEKCEGNYKLSYDEARRSWLLIFEPSDKNSNPFVKCKGNTVVVWTADKGYVVGDTLVTLNDPLDQTPVTNKCDIGE